MDALSKFLESILDCFRAIWNSITGFTAGVTSNSVKFNNNEYVNVDKCIGEGAFSFVYVGKSSSSHRKYALKKVLIQSGAIAENIEAEIASLKRFKHPNIIDIVDYVYTKDNGMRVCWLLFPYAEKGTLRHELSDQLIGRCRRHTLEHVLSQFAQIVDALRYLHEYTPSYVHFDVKPENILLFSDGKPVLTDFGSVRPAIRPVSSRSASLQISEDAAENCTISFRAPELFDPAVGTTLDARTDSWALGCLLFAWWYGYSPFECEFVSANNNSSNTATSTLSASKKSNNSRSGNRGNNSNSSSDNPLIDIELGGGHSPTVSTGLLADEDQLSSSNFSNSNNSNTSADQSNMLNSGTDVGEELQQPFDMKVVQCAYLRVLGTVPKHPYHNSNSSLALQSCRNSTIIDALVANILIQDMTKRPTSRELQAVIERKIEEIRK